MQNPSFSPLHLFIMVFTLSLGWVSPVFSDNTDILLQAPVDAPMDWVGKDKAITPDIMEEVDWVHPRVDPSALELGKSLNEKNVLNSLKSFRKGSEALRALGFDKPALDQQNANRQFPQTPLPEKGAQNPIYVFISLSLPEDYLRGLLEMGAGRSDIRFIVQGWVPPKIGDLQYGLGRLISDPKHPPNIQIDPSIFKRHAIEYVPVFLQENKDGKFRRLDGEISLDGAVAWLRGQRPMPEDPIGPVHEIEEPNILDELQKRLAKFDWRSEIAKARERAQQKVQGHPLPRATRDAVYWVDISTTITQDIKLPDGRIVAKAGSRINPLDVVALRQRYVFFDPTDPSQIAVVKRWQKAHNNLKLIASELAPLSKETDELIQNLGQMVFPSNRLLVERFQIQSVPALVEQDQGLLKITVVKPHWGEDADIPVRKQPEVTHSHAISKKED